MSKRSSIGDKIESGPPENGSGDVPAAPLSDEDEAPKKQKLSMSFKKKGDFKLLDKPVASSPVKKGIQIKLGAQKTAQQTNTVKPQSQSVAAMFNVDDDEEPEEMPPEARMRMRNIGRETPTSAGPNSFGKTKQGFCDAKKMFEKNLKKKMDNVGKASKPTSESPSSPSSEGQAEPQDEPEDEPQSSPDEPEASDDE